MKRQNMRTLSLVTCTFTYLLVGAAVFDALESDNERVEKVRLEVEEEEFRKRFNVSFDDYRKIAHNVIRSVPHKAGIQWKFAGAFYFATTVITTIGYGYSTPKTSGGKIFCMLYAMAGIPLNLVMFQCIGERLNILFTCVLRRLKRCFRSYSHFRSSGEAPPVDVSQTLLIVVCLNTSSIVVAGGAWVFSHFEGWSYLDSFYYCVITLTTIGFGDFVALQRNHALQNRPEYVVFSLVFILFGLAILSAAMNLLVLRFLTMNTEDEIKDELEAAAAVKSAVHLDGDIITRKHQPETEVARTSADKQKLSRNSGLAKDRRWGREKGEGRGGGNLAATEGSAAPSQATQRSVIDEDDVDEDTGSKMAPTTSAVSSASTLSVCSFTCYEFSDQLFGRRVCWGRGGEGKRRRKDEEKEEDSKSVDSEPESVRMGETRSGSLEGSEEELGVERKGEGSKARRGQGGFGEVLQFRNSL